MEQGRPRPPATRGHRMILLLQQAGNRRGTEAGSCQNKSPRPPASCRGRGCPPVLNVGPSLHLVGHTHPDNLVGIADRAIISRRSFLDLVDDIHARHDLADNRILIVQEITLLEHNEEL